MGKSSKSSKTSTASSYQSNRSSKSSLNSNMSCRKRENILKRKRKKQRTSIQNLFAKLREQSCSSNDDMQNQSVILIQDSPIVKRKASDEKLSDKVKLRRSNSMNNLIVIKDDDDTPGDASTTKIHTPTKVKSMSPICSTPISENIKLSHNKLNISNVSVLNNNLDQVQNLNNNNKDLTKEINPQSYITIDLTNETLTLKNSNMESGEIIDLSNVSNNSNCTVVSRNEKLSLSGDSQVTVINMGKEKNELNNEKMQRFADGIANLNPTEKGRLLEIITQNIFSGCKMPVTAVCPVKASENRGTDTLEDTYIKEVIIGRTQSRNSIGSNIYNPENDPKNKKGLRMIVIDGSNVAMEHLKGRQFSVKGLKICIEYFVKRGHVVKAFVPRFRCKFGKSTDPRLLDELERVGYVVYTPSREVQGRQICSYDDRYIVQCAAEFDGVIVSGDNYRDLMQENPRWRFVIENRLLQFTWVNDMIMFPRDPLGRTGPTLEAFLRHPL